MVKDVRRHVDVMGIVNVTDNSYFADSRCLAKDGQADVERALERAGRLVQEGAGIIDVGACSTRPGSEPVGESKEWKRLEPVLKAIREKHPAVRISIDTYWASVVEKAYDAIGDFIVNDVTAGEGDARMLGTAGKLGLTYIAMHMRGTPKTMQSLTDYPEGVTTEVIRYFREFATKAEKAGIRDWIIDPGFGFAKTIEQNYELMRNLEAFEVFGRKILVGVSRKSMIYRLFDITPEEALPATQALHLRALQLGADILRVHDVAQTMQTVEIWKRLG